MTHDDFDDRLAMLEAQMRALTDAVNAMALRQRPGPVMRFIQHPAMWGIMAAMLASGAGFTWRSIDAVASHGRRIRAIEELVPISRRNQERIAKGVDNICYGMQDVREALKLRPRDCDRTEIEPIYIPQQEP